MTLPPLPDKVQLDKHESGYVIWGYTAAQMREYATQAALAVRQPLTDEQINALKLPESGAGTIRDLVRIVERAHGIGKTK